MRPIALCVLLTALAGFIPLGAQPAWGQSPPALPPSALPPSALPPSALPPSAAPPAAAPSVPPFAADPAAPSAGVGQAVGEAHASPDPAAAEPGASEAAAEEDGSAPRGLEAQYRAGVQALRQGNTARAEQAFQAVLRGAPYHVLSHLALGRLYLTQRPDLARVHLETVRRVHPSSEDAHYLLGQAYEALGRHLDAAESYRYVIYLNPRHYNANARLRGVLRRMRAGRTVLERAADSFYRAPSMASLTLYGRLVMQHAEPREAVLEFEEVRRRQPELSEVELWIARARHAAGEEDGELAAYRRYLEQKPLATGVRLLLVERLSAQGWYRDAATLLEPLQEGARETMGGAEPAPRERIPPDTRARVTYLRSRLLSAQGNPADAVDLLLEADAQHHPAAAIAAAFAEDLALFPDNGALWLGYARWRLAVGTPDEAADALAEAGRLDAALRPQVLTLLEGLRSEGRAPVAAALALGELAWSVGQPAQALEFLQAVPAGHALDHRAALLRGLIHRSRGELEQALNAFMRYVFFFADRQDMVYARGNLFWRLEQREEALAVWMAEPDVLLRHPGVLLKLAQFHQQRGDAQAEREVRERLAQAVPANHASRIRLGALYEQAGRRMEAILLWERVLADRPRDATLLIAVGKGWLQLGDGARGLPLLRRASQLGALDVETTVLLARELYNARQFEEALSVYWRLYQEHPERPEAAQALPDLALNLPVTGEQRRAAVKVARADGRLALATELLEVLLADSPGDAETRLQLAESYLAQGQTERAEAVLLVPQASPAERLRGLELLAQAQTQLGRREGLAQTLARQQLLTPDDRALMRRRGLLLAEMRRPKEAEPLLSEALADNPSDGRVRLALAEIAQSRGEVDAAIGHLQVVLAGAPDNESAQRRLIDLLLRRQRWEEVAAPMEAWLAGHPRDEQVRYNLISAYLKLFRKEDARPHFEVLRALNPARTRALEAYFR